MKQVHAFTQPHTTDEGCEQDDRLIAEAKQRLYARLQTAGERFTALDGVKDYLSLQLADRQQEVFVALLLNNQHRLLAYRELFIGTIDGCSVYPRDVVRSALLCNANAVIVAHNHPSQWEEPSQADIHITRRLRDALALVDIRLLDHLLVAGRRTVSMAERGLL